MLSDGGKINKYEFNKLIVDNNINSMNDFIKFVYDYNDIEIRDNWFKKPKNTLMNRINTLWVYPIFVISIPIRYVIYGDFYINKNTKLGKVMEYLLGNMYK